MRLMTDEAGMKVALSVMMRKWAPGEQESHPSCYTSELRFEH